MKLPVLDAHTFSCTLPSSGKNITLRPYLVREEKLLLMAQASDNYDDHVSAIAQIIKNCTNGNVNPEQVPYFDIEYLLLQLRAQSVGEIATPIYVCHNKPNGDEVECGHRTPVEINLTEISVTGLDQPAEKFILKLSDQYTLHLRYPSVYTIHKLVVAAYNEGEMKTDSFMEALCDVFDTLESHTDGQTFQFADFTTVEKLEFLESLSTRTYEELVAFLDIMPTVAKSIEFACEKCQFRHTIELSGVSDFLG